MRLEPKQQTALFNLILILVIIIAGLVVCTCFFSCKYNKPTRFLESPHAGADLKYFSDTFTVVPSAWQQVPGKAEYVLYGSVPDSLYNDDIFSLSVSTLAGQWRSPGAAVTLINNAKEIIIDFRSEQRPAAPLRFKLIVLSPVQ
jgi:hypothetical protein